jgi:pilus assembly protein CpaF
MTTIGPALEDDAVTEIAIAGAGPIVVMRGGRRTTVEPPLSSETSVRRVLTRLLRQAKAVLTPEQTLITRKLPSGFRLTAVTGARAPSGTLLRLDRVHRVDATLDDLVRAGAVSRAVATFLRHCVSVRANILVVGSKGARPAVVAGALASASPDGHVVAVQDTNMIVSNSVSVSHIDVTGMTDDLGALIDFAGRMPEARLVVDNFVGATAAAVLDAVSSGADGLVAVANAGSLRRALARLPADLAASRPGLAIPAAREWIAGTFDVLIEVARLRDGRQRVIRVAEPAGSESGEILFRDVFAFVVERMVTGGVVEGTFQATGVAPRVVGDMAARGIHIDSGVFSRPPSR